MSSRNRVIWREGLFIKPQHFQQLQRHCDYQLHARVGALGDYGFGLLSLGINQDYLALGRIALDSGFGVMPDGTVFNLPAEEDLPAPLELSDGHCLQQRVYLAVPLAMNGVQEISHAGQVVATRLLGHRQDIHDVHSGTREAVAVELGKMNVRLMLEKEDRSAYASIPVARILDLRPDGSIVLDPEFMPCAMRVSAIVILKRFLDELAGLVRARAGTLARRIAMPGQQGVAEVSDFMLLQLLNRTQPLLAHLSAQDTLHPLRLFEVLVQLYGELMTFTNESRLPAFTPAYRHEDLHTSFEPLLQALRMALGTVLSPRAVALPLQEQSYGIQVAVTGDSDLMASADFVLAVRARMPQEAFRKQFLQQTKIASSERLLELVSLQLPGVPLLSLPVAPRQLPYHAGFSYFQLDRQSPAWAMLTEGTHLAFHIAGEFPELEMQLWAIRDQ